ncbi:uncharacterized protein LOC106155660 [Lingula anatina]|uniref:Uncharacterized protein LOC106155660 n=1 Tax=Lingula anatina TaxID=7574 RepID=A0A1S3HKQ3_LINAN|nr:uncharacterized protein LOC106155660 [Lingula anatina]XP_013386047.1 uncharacterized protein LOC106155660 [Lingula anatina]XP_013386048.1 uncharacterized protein LOC106155660 [Lingula anatina]|eukprot:XP_013386046.1 uncharacterized protein LOC106155660 [Lingula anatina]
MNVKTILYNRVRLSDQKNWSYKMDASIRNRSEQRNRVEDIQCQHLKRQFDLERQLSSMELSQQQKTLLRKMDNFKERIEECNERHLKRKKSQEQTDNSTLIADDYFSDRRLRKSMTRSKTFPPADLMKSEPFQSRDLTNASHKADMGYSDHNKIAPPPESSLKLKRSKTDISYYVPLYEPEAIGSVRRQMKFASNANRNSSKFLLRAITDLEKLEHKHLEEFDHNMHQMKALEEKTGLRLHMSKKIKREIWQPPPTPENPQTPANSVADMSYFPDHPKSHNTKKGKSRKISRQSLQLPSISPNQRENTKQNKCGKPSVHFKEDDPTKDPFISKLNTFLNKPNPEAKYTPKRKTVETKPTEFKASRSLALPKINIGSIAMAMSRDSTANPFSGSADAPLPLYERDRGLIDSNQENSMWVWLGFESEKEFMKALEARKQMKKLAAAGNKEATAELPIEPDELDAFLDNLSDVSTDDESDHERDHEDARFTVFQDESIRKKEKEMRKKKKAEQQKIKMMEAQQQQHPIDAVAAAQEPLKKDAKERMRTAFQAVLAMKALQSGMGDGTTENSNAIPE